MSGTPDRLLSIGDFALLATQLRALNPKRYRDVSEALACLVAAEEDHACALAAVIRVLQLDDVTPHHSV